MKAAVRYTFRALAQKFGLKFVLFLRRFNFSDVVAAALAEPFRVTVRG